MKLNANSLIIHNLMYFGLNYEELRIVALLLDGRDTETIAKDLSLNESTVVYYLSSILKKLRLKSRYQLQVFCSKLSHQKLDYGTQDINRPN